MFGDLTDGRHTFRQADHSWGIKLHEPQITQGWLHFLSPERIGAHEAAIRAGSVLRALRRASGWADVDASRIIEGSVRVVAEEVMKRENGKRIDLLVQWETKDNQRDGFIVEFKFGHHITVSQLPAYRRYFLREVLGPASLKDFELSKRLFVIGAAMRPSDSRALRRNRDWSFATWPEFLRSFEHETLALGHNDHDEVFGSFRRAVWARLME